MKRFTNGEIITAARLNQLLNKVYDTQLLATPIHPESALTSFLQLFRRRRKAFGKDRGF